MTCRVNSYKRIPDKGGSGRTNLIVIVKFLIAKSRPAVAL